MVLDPNDPDEVQRVHAFTERLARYFKSHSCYQHCFVFVFSDLKGLAKVAAIHQEVVYCNKEWEFEELVSFISRNSDVVRAWTFLYCENNLHQ